MFLPFSSYHIATCMQIDVGAVSNLHSLQGAAWKVDSDIPPTQSPQTSAHKYILSVQIVSSALEATNQDFCLHLLRLHGGRGADWGEKTHDGSTGEEKSVLNQCNKQWLPLTVYEVVHCI